MRNLRTGARPVTRKRLRYFVDTLFLFMLAGMGASCALIAETIF